MEKNMKSYICVCVCVCIYIYKTESLCCTVETKHHTVNQLYFNKKNFFNEFSIKQPALHLAYKRHTLQMLGAFSSHPNTTLLLHILSYGFSHCLQIFLLYTTLRQRLWSRKPYSLFLCTWLTCELLYVLSSCPSASRLQDISSAPLQLLS